MKKPRKGILAGKINENNIIGNKQMKKLIISIEEAKNKHTCISGCSGAGKSASSIPFIGEDIYQSILSYDENLRQASDKTYLGSVYNVIDPHSGITKDINEYVLKLISNGKNKINHEYKSKIFAKSRSDTEEELIVNPLHVKSLAKITSSSDFIKTLDLFSYSTLDSLRAYYSQIGFGNRNESLIIFVFQFLIILNYLKYKRFLELREKHNKVGLDEKEKEDLIKNSIMYSLGDIPGMLQNILFNGILDKDYLNGLKEILNHEKETLRNLGEQIKNSFENLYKVVKVNVEFVQSTINKFTIFSTSLYSTFGGNKSIINYTLDLPELFINYFNETRFYGFNLGDFNIKEKGMIASFIFVYNYYFITQKDYKNEKVIIGDHTLICDEFTSVINGSGAGDVDKVGILDQIIIQTLTETRKMKCRLVLYNQYYTRLMKTIYANMSIIIIHAINNEDAKFLIEDLNACSNDIVISEKDLVNQKLGDFFLLQKLKKGNLLISVSAFNYKDPDDFNDIIDYFNKSF